MKKKFLVLGLYEKGVLAKILFQSKKTKDYVEANARIISELASQFLALIYKQGIRFEIEEDAKGFTMKFREAEPKPVAFGSIEKMKSVLKEGGYCEFIRKFSVKCKGCGSNMCSVGILRRGEEKHMIMCCHKCGNDWISPLNYDGLFVALAEAIKKQGENKCQKK